MAKLSTIALFVTNLSIGLSVLNLAFATSGRDAIGLHSANHLSPKERAESLMAQMTLSEKIGYLHGDPWLAQYVGHVPGIDRLKIPSQNLNDGPQGYVCIHCVAIAELIPVQYC